MILNTTPLAFCIRDQEGTIVNTGLVHAGDAVDMADDLVEPEHTLALVPASIQIH